MCPDRTREQARKRTGSLCQNRLKVPRAPKPGLIDQGKWGYDLISGFTKQMSAIPSLPAEPAGKTVTSSIPNFMSQGQSEKPISLRNLQPTGSAPAEAKSEKPAKVLIKSIRDLAGQVALWRQPSPLRQDYEMVVNDEVIATLRWKKIGGSTAIARAPEGTWTFKSAGFLTPRVTIRLPNSDYDFGTFRTGASGSGTLESLGDQKFQWRCVNFMQNAWAFFDDEGNKLVQIRPEVQGNKPTGVVEIGVKASGRQEIGFLVIFAWYLLVLTSEDVAAANPPASA